MEDPMSAMAETAGSFSRMVLLTDALKEANIDTAVCLSQDVNYKPIDGIKNYFLSISMPFGLPERIARHTRNAIQDFNPDVIYSEFNVSAIIAGRMEKKKIFITASMPTQFAYANTPR